MHRYLWPKVFAAPFWMHYKFAWRQVPDLGQIFTNSVEVTLGTIVCATVASVLAGYALVHLETPAQARRHGLAGRLDVLPDARHGLDRYFSGAAAAAFDQCDVGIDLPYTALSVAVSTFIMRGIFETVPKEIIHSAHLDGASSMRTLLEIVLPMVRNGIVVVIIVNFVAAWGEYLLALTLMNDQSHRTLPVVIANATGGPGAWGWPNIAAVYIMTVIPGLLAFGLSQRWYLQGLQEGAMKT